MPLYIFMNSFQDFSLLRCIYIGMTQISGLYQNGHLLNTSKIKTW